MEFNLLCIKYRGNKIYGWLFINTIRFLKRFEKSDEVSKFSRATKSVLSVNVRFQ